MKGRWRRLVADIPGGPEVEVAIISPTNRRIHFTVVEGCGGGSVGKEAAVSA